MLFEYYEDSIYVYNEVIKRLRSYNLQLQLDKTQIFEFSRKKITTNTFDYLGLNIYNYKDKNNIIKIGIKTKEKNIQKKYQEIKECILNNENDDINTLCNKLNDKLRGYYNYYGFNTNINWLIEIYNYTLKELNKYLINNYNFIPLTIEQLSTTLPIIKPYISIYI